jgi:hypothetical protein
MGDTPTTITTTGAPVMFELFIEVLGEIRQAKNRNIIKGFLVLDAT